MEDQQPISDAEQAAFCVELAKRLNMLRRQDHLCDVTLVTKDETKFKAHRNVLSAASPFFFKLLQSDMKENREGIVRFEEISGAVMEDVLEFIYTGSVEVTQEFLKQQCLLCLLKISLHFYGQRRATRALETKFGLCFGVL